MSDELEEVLLATKDSLLATIFGGSGTKKTDLQKIQAGLNTIKKGLQQMSPQQPTSHKIAKPTLGFVFKVRLMNSFRFCFLKFSTKLKSNFFAAHIVITK